MPYDPTPLSNYEKGVLELKKRFSDKSKWHQGSYNGPNDSHCIVGHLLSMLLDDETDYAIRRALHKKSWILFKRGITRTNDFLGYEAVLQVLKEL